MTIGVITELSDADKDPNFYGLTTFGAGGISAGELPIKLLLVGAKHASAGSLTPDTEVVRVFTETDLDTYAGAGGELARMGYAAFAVAQALGGNLELYIAAISDASGAAAATATITIGGSWTAGGSFRIWVGGMEITGPVLSSDTATTLGATIAATINAKARCPASAASTTGTITLTWKSVGTRGNQGIVYQDISGLPSGATSTLGGSGAAVAGDATTGNGKYFAGGSGTDDVEDLLTTIFPSRYHRIAIPHRDTTNLGKWEVQLDQKAGPAENRMEHAVCGSVGTFSAASAVALSPLNNWRFQLLHLEASETPMEEVVAAFAVMRTITEQTTQNVSYSGRTIPGVRPQRARSFWYTRSKRIAALNSGVTPLQSNESGGVTIGRSITTRSQTSTGDPDYRTLDTSDSVVPDFVRDDLRLYWITVFLPANPYVDEDPPNESKEVASKIATPKRWNAAVQSRLLLHQANFLLTAVAQNPPKTTYNRAAKRLASIVPTKVLPRQEQIEVNVLQVA